MPCKIQLHWCARRSSRLHPHDGSKEAFATRLLLLGIHETLCVPLCHALISAHQLGRCSDCTVQQRNADIGPLRLLLQLHEHIDRRDVHAICTDLTAPPHLCEAFPHLWWPRKQKALQRNRILAIARAAHLVSGGYVTPIAALLDTTPCSAQKAYHRFASHSLILIVKVPPQLRSPPVGSDNSSGQKSMLCHSFWSMKTLERLNNSRVR